MDQAYCDALRFAFDYEQKGERHYREAGASARDRFAKRALTFLADEEVEHIRKIDDFNRHLLGEADFDLDAECALTLSERVESFLEQAKKLGDVGEQRDLTDLDVYDLAMENEKEGFELYSAAERTSTEERLKRFFAFLSEEERGHYKLLEATKKYLDDPSYYFEEGGGWLFS